MSKPSRQAEPATEAQRKRISQEDVPSCSLEKAISIPRAIAESYASAPATPLQIAESLKVSPTSGTFRMITGAAIAYGLTNGGYAGTTIAITSLGKRIVMPTVDDDDLIAKRKSAENVPDEI